VSDPAPQPAPPHPRPPYHWGWQQYLALVVAALLVTLLRLYVVESDIVSGPSMEPALQPGDYVLVYKLGVGNGREPERNSVVTLVSPLDPREILVKRVGGLPGDVIQYQGDQVLVNGVPMGRSGTPPGVGMGLPEYVPPGHVFVLGDNREDSEDSRDWGPIKITALRGKALLVYLPPGRIGLVR